MVGSVVESRSGNSVEQSEDDRNSGVDSVRRLGELRVVVDGTGHDLPPGNRQRAVWCALALSPGKVVTIDSIKSLVWGSAPPRRSRESVHVYISQLRIFLQEAGLSPQLIETRPGGYRLAVARSRVDWCELTERMSRARALLRKGEFEESVRIADSALEVYEEPILGGVRGGVGFEAFAIQIEELQASLLEIRMEALMELGQAHSLVHELQALAYRHPMREVLHSQLMRALFVTGRQIDALEVYSRLRTTLREEFGVEPSQATQEYHAALLDADATRLRGQLGI